jgi:ubiquinone/menaquinone biosynthesis C-methylase UbiE
MTHNELIQQAFAQQSAHFEEQGLTLTSAEYLQWMVKSLPAQAHFRVLDVASGTGLLARAIAPFVKEVVALDTTPEMLQTARQEIERAQIANITLQEGQAEHLLFPQDSFDLVVSRLALHHFVSPEVQLGEMCRVCKPGHMVCIIDLLSPSQKTLIEPYNRLERMRDPSHTRALTRDELVDMIRHAGLQLCFEDMRDIEVDVERWLRMTHTPEDVGEQIRNQLKDEIEGRGQTGMRPYFHEGQLKFMQTWGIFIGETL